MIYILINNFYRVIESICVEPHHHLFFFFFDEKLLILIPTVRHDSHPITILEHI